MSGIFNTILPQLLAIRTYPDEGEKPTYLIGVGEAYEWIERLLGNERVLTTTGIQWNVDDGDAVGTAIQNTETDLYTFTLDSKGRDALVEYFMFGLTVGLIQVTGAVNGVVKWYIRPGTTGAWTLIHTSAGIALGAVYADYTCSGYWQPASDFAYPMQIKITLTTDHAANMGNGKVKNSSFVGVYAR